ncbi:MAG: crotonase/enoyl-CoA hydratase family protein [Actinobacteria bacterium]|nr:MAG: crotonase/enoyl-CoA hydratase family protein [Actinomycetota bacterium]
MPNSETEPALLVEVDGGIATLTLNRPAKLNSLDPELVCRLADAWDQLAADPAIRVAIVTGAGDRAFCTGADLGRLIPLFTGARPVEDEWDERLKSDLRLLDKALLRRTDFTVPVIAAVRGFALAGGTELVLGTDLRIAAEDSEFGLTEVSRGIIPAGGGLAKLARQVPWAKAAEIVLVGDRISARAAADMGLVNRLVPAAEVMGEAMSLAKRMATNGPLAMRKAKEVMITSNGLPFDDAYKIESKAAGIVMSSADAIEGPRAFMEKRTPNYTGT